MNISSFVQYACVNFCLVRREERTLRGVRQKGAEADINTEKEKMTWGSRKLNSDGFYK
jgi:hypothetical protein